MTHHLHVHQELVYVRGICLNDLHGCCRRTMDPENHVVSSDGSRNQFQQPRNVSTWECTRESKRSRKNRTVKPEQRSCYHRTRSCQPRFCGERLCTRSRSAPRTHRTSLVSRCKKMDQSPCCRPSSLVMTSGANMWLPTLRPTAAHSIHVTTWKARSRKGCAA